MEGFCVGETSQPNSIKLRGVDLMVHARALPFGNVSIDEIARKRSFGDAIGLAAEVAGLDLDKQASAQVGMDKAQWSRIQSGQEGIKWSRLEKFLDGVGNDIPILWMLYQRGYDLHSIRRRETELERELREAREALATEQIRTRALMDALRGGARESGVK
jgi:hypothetical protein